MTLRDRVVRKINELEVSKEYYPDWEIQQKLHQLNEALTDLNEADKAYRRVCELLDCMDDNYSIY